MEWKCCATNLGLGEVALRASLEYEIPYPLIHAWNTIILSFWDGGYRKAGQYSLRMLHGTNVLWARPNLIPTKALPDAADTSTNTSLYTPIPGCPALVSERITLGILRLDGIQYDIQIAQLLFGLIQTWFYGTWLEEILTM